MVGLLAYVAGTTVNNAISLDRAPNLINATSLPAVNSASTFRPSAPPPWSTFSGPPRPTWQAYEAAITATDKAEPAFTGRHELPGHHRARDSQRG